MQGCFPVFFLELRECQKTRVKRTSRVPCDICACCVSLTHASLRLRTNIPPCPSYTAKKLVRPAGLVAGSFERFKTAAWASSIEIRQPCMSETQNATFSSSSWEVRCWKRERYHNPTHMKPIVWGKQTRMLVFGPLEMATTPKACIPRGARPKVQRTLSTIGSDKICPILYRPESKVSGEPIWTPSRRSFVQIASGAALRLTTTLRCASIARSRRFYFGRSTRDSIFLVFASSPSFVPFATLGTDESVWYVGLKALLDRGNPA